jgi:hypothetical protein
MTTRDFIVVMDEPSDGDKILSYVNILQIRMARMGDDGVLTIWFSESHTMTFSGKAATAIIEHLADRSRVLDGSVLKIEKRVAVHLAE